MKKKVVLIKNMQENYRLIEALQSAGWTAEEIINLIKEGLIKSTRMDWRANFHAPRGKKSQEYLVYFKIF